MTVTSHLLHEPCKFNKCEQIVFLFFAIQSDFVYPLMFRRIAQPLGCTMNRILITKQSAAIILASSLLTVKAEAGGFEGKTMRDPFPNRSVERGLVLGKGWFQIYYTF